MENAAAPAAPASFVNLCPYSVTVVVDNLHIALEAAERPARTTDKRVTAWSLGKQKLDTVIKGVTTGLPVPAPQTFYVVTMRVYLASSQRHDLLGADPSLDDDSVFVNFPQPRAPLRPLADARLTPTSTPGTHDSEVLAPFNQPAVDPPRDDHFEMFHPL